MILLFFMCFWHILIKKNHYIYYSKLCKKNNMILKLYITKEKYNIISEIYIRKIESMS